MVGTRDDELTLAICALVGHTIRDVEMGLIRATLDACGGNRTLASRMLGISTRTLRNKVGRRDLSSDARAASTTSRGPSKPPSSADAAHQAESQARIDADKADSRREVW